MDHHFPLLRQPSTDDNDAADDIFDLEIDAESDEDSVTMPSLQVPLRQPSFDSHLSSSDFSSMSLLKAPSTPTKKTNKGTNARNEKNDKLVEEDDETVDGDHDYNDWTTPTFESPSSMDNDDDDHDDHDDPILLFLESLAGLPFPS